MAIYSIKRFSAKDSWNNMEDKAARWEHKHPYLSHGIAGKQYQKALKETLTTGRSDGKEAKKLHKHAAILGGVTGGLGGAAIGSVKGVKGAALGTAVGAAAGAGLNALGTKISMKSQEKKLGNSIYNKERWADNLKVADGDMSENDFDKKWKK